MDANTTVSDTSYISYLPIKNDLLRLCNLKAEEKIPIVFFYQPLNI